MAAMCMYLCASHSLSKKKKKQNDILVSADEQLRSIDECGAARVCGALIFFGKKFSSKL